MIYDLPWKNGKQGVWVTFHYDSGYPTRVWADELLALRQAIESYENVVFLPLGMSIQEEEHQRRAAQ